MAQKSLAEESVKTFKILSLDGGGVRAVIQAVLIGKLAQTFPSLLSEIDMFAGTSAGCIVAGAFASGFSASEVNDLFLTELPKIFEQGYLHRARTLDDVIGAAYSPTELENMLTKILGDIKLKDLKPKFLSPSFKLDPVEGKESENPRWQPVFFHNFPNSENADTRLADVILRTTAAPTYFPIRDGYVDGGTFANNPALCAITTAISAGVARRDITVLSISTGLNPQFIAKQKIGNGNWGLAEWGPWIIDLLFEAATQSVDHQCKCLLEKKYLRLDPLLPRNVGLDETTALPDLIKAADAIDLTEAIDWLRREWGLKLPGEVPDTPKEEATTAPDRKSVV